MKRTRLWRVLFPTKSKLNPLRAKFKPLQTAARRGLNYAPQAFIFLPLSLLIIVMQVL